MKLLVFCIYDVKAGYYHPPFCKLTVNEAIRDFSMLVNPDQPNLISKHPSDFSLFHVAEFDQDTSKFISSLPLQVAVGHDFIYRPNVSNLTPSPA